MAVILYILFLLLTAVVAVAQTGSSLQVNVYGYNNQGIESARICLWPSGRTQLTDEQGRADFTELSAGAYRIEVSSQDYSPIDTQFIINAAQLIVLQVKLHERMITLPEVVIESLPNSSTPHYFTYESIHSSSAKSLTDFLEQYAGLDIRTDGTPGTAKTAQIGGSNAKQVTVLVDGNRLQDPGDGTADLSTIPLEWIESIEVFRGGQTSFSNEAIGGIIRIKTRSAGNSSEINASEDVHSTYSTTSFSRIGSLGQFSNIVSISHTQGPGDFRYKISEEDGNGEFTTNLGKSFRRANADLVRDQLFLKVSSGIGKRGELTGTWMMDNARLGMPGYIAPYLTPHARERRKQDLFSLSMKHPDNVSDIEGRLSYQTSDREFTDSDPSSIVNRSTEASRKWEAELNTSTRIKKSVILLGAQTSREAISGNQIANQNAARNRWSVWSQWNYLWHKNSYQKLTVNSECGLRTEEYSKNKAVILPRGALNLSYAPSYRIELGIAYSRSYRAPTFNELFWQYDQVANGNPDLKAETSAEFAGNISIKTASSNPTKLLLSASDQSVHDLIFWKQTFNNQWKPFNLHTAHIQTLNLSLDQSLIQEHLNIGVGADWTEAKNASDDRNIGGKYLTFRPLSSLRVNTSLREYGALLSLSYRRYSKRPVLETNTKWLGAYQLLDVHLGYNLRIKHLSLKPSLSIENLLNENYRIIRFAPMPGREYSASLHITWNSK